MTAILADSISGVFAGTFLLLDSEVLSGIINLSGSMGAMEFGVAPWAVTSRTNSSTDAISGRRLVWRGNLAGDW